MVSTKPSDPKVTPLIVLTIGDTSWAMTMVESSEVATELRAKAESTNRSGEKIVLRSGETAWDMSSAEAMRIGRALEDEMLVVQVGR